jgi:hypothetical protein
MQLTQGGECCHYFTNVKGNMRNVIQFAFSNAISSPLSVVSWALAILTHPKTPLPEPFGALFNHLGTK